jgi:pimeloyl-ACP methyl ester carboxylesterase
MTIELAPFESTKPFKFNAKFLALLLLATLVGKALAEETKPASLLGWPDCTVDDWHGYQRYNFTVAGCPAWVVEPRKALPGNPWSWCLEFPDAFTDRCATPQLLAAGYFSAHIVVGNTFGCPKAVEQFNAFYRKLIAQGLNLRPVLIGISRGGLYAYRWAAENPGKVGAIYGDAPVCDFKSWPAGKGKGIGSPPDWQALIQAYGFKDEAEALAYTHNPIDTLAPLAAARIPIIHVVGDSDDVVPVAENTAILEKRYRELGGTIKVIHKPGVGHHPHGLDDPAPVVEFILKNNLGQ